MSSINVLIDTTNIKASNELDRLSSYDPKESLESLIHLLEAFKQGNKSGVATIAIDKDAVAAHGHITFSGEVSVDDAISVNGVAYTAKASPTGEVQFKADADPGVSAASFVTVFNGSTSAKLTSITASNVSGAITLTADVAGVSGNGFKIVKTTGTNVAVTDFSGGTDGTGYDFTV